MFISEVKVNMSWRQCIYVYVCLEGWGCVFLKSSLVEKDQAWIIFHQLHVTRDKLPFIFLKICIYLLIWLGRVLNVAHQIL